jgi:phosphate transport system permease protein
LFIYAVLILGLGWGFSGAAAALALSILMLPTITRTSEEILRLVPGGLREAALALGAPEWRSVWQVVLPTARAGIVTAVILGIARVVGETAPLLLTSVGADTMNINPFHGQQSSLPLFVFKQIKTLGLPNTISRGYAGAFVLLVIVLILFVSARLIGRARPERRGKTRRRNRRARKRVQNATTVATPTTPGKKTPSAGKHRRRRRREKQQT